MKRTKAIYTKVSPVIKDGKWASETIKNEVRVMAFAEGYAMVRYKGCTPFAVPEKNLEILP
jgi:hypothetical protein